MSGGRFLHRSIDLPTSPYEGLPLNWVCRWNTRLDMYEFRNEQTGYVSLQHPSYYMAGYEPRIDPDQGKYQREYQQQEEEYEQPQKKESHGMAYGAMGAAAGLVGGALLMHEGEKIEDDYETDKYRVENDFDNAGGYVEEKFDNGVNDVENFPDDAARWTGEKVGEVENIPQDVEYDYDRAKYGAENHFDNAVQDVENVPQDIGNRFDDAAGWVGNKVGDFERFDHGVDNAYDQGRNEGRDGW